MRESISAQSCDSVPPAPELMVKMQFFLSCGPLRNNFSSSASSSLKNGTSSRVSSASICACDAAGSASASSTMTLKSSSCFSNLKSGSSLLRMAPASSMAACAFSRLFQKFSSAINEFSSVRRFCKVATSKKPPQVRELLGGGRQLGDNHFEHGGRIQKPEFRIQKGNFRRQLQRLSLALRFLLRRTRRRISNARMSSARS